MCFLKCLKQKVIRYVQQKAKQNPMPFSSMAVSFVYKEIEREDKP